MEPALIYRDIREAAQRGGWEVEVILDIAWIFLHRPGFRADDFGDERVRASRLGKWIASFPREGVVEQAKKLLPFISAGVVRDAKLTNVGNVSDKPAKIVVYCLDRDAGIRNTLEGFGWSVRWKFNFETYTRRANVI